MTVYGLDLVTIQDQITAQMKAVYPNTVIIEDGVLDDSVLARDTNGFMDPYIVLRYGLLEPDAGKSLGGSRLDEYYSTVDIDVIAPVGHVARQILTSVVDQLTGWKPANSNALTPDGGAYKFVIPASATRPTTFLASIRFKYGANTTGIGVPIPYPPV